MNSKNNLTEIILSKKMEKFGVLILTIYNNGDEFDATAEN